MSIDVIAGVDIGGTNISVGLITKTGELLGHKEFPTEPAQGFESAVNKIANHITDLIQSDNYVLFGIGIGCTGRHNRTDGSLGNVETFLPGWQGKNITSAFHDKFNVPVSLENDADAAAIGEHTWGIGQGTSRFLLVTVGTGIGVGLTIDGQLYRGAQGAHPEIGHHIIDSSEGTVCWCGSQGCWEGLASSGAMTNWWINNYSDTQDVKSMNAREICKAAKMGDKYAIEAVNRQGFYLGLGLSNLMTLFAPDMIALGGGLMRSLDLFMDNIQKSIEINCTLVPHHNTKVLPARFGTEAVLVGAASTLLTSDIC